jgi:NAD(P)H-nitrite reductase large subunit
VRTIDHLIIGGGAAGTTAAEVIRSKDADATVAIVSAEAHRLYSRVLLPNVVRGKIPEASAFLRTDAHYQDRRIELMTGRSVVAIDGVKRVVRLADGEELAYGKLLLATGGTPRRLDCPGGDNPEILSFQTIEDARALIAAPRDGAVVIGGGFIALEIAMSFAHFGAAVTCVLRGDGFFSHVLDRDSMAMLADHVTRNGVTLARGVTVKGIERDGAMGTVFLSDGQRLRCSAVGAGIGIVPNVGFLEGCGVEVGRGIRTDSRLRTAVENVFAAGDAVEFEDELTGERRMVGNWTNALLQGKAAGMNMAGEVTPFRAVTSYTITCFGLAVTFLGATDLIPEARIVRRTENATIQFLIRGGMVVGATCIGPFPERAAAMKVVESRVRLEDKGLTALADRSVPLDAILG